MVEIGNLKNFETFVPSQDKNKKFLGKTLGEICSKNKFHQFSYENVVRKAKTVDVSWFNARKMPNVLFEVEHSTDIQNPLLKFLELQDFNTKFFIVADDLRKREFEGKLSLSAFTLINERIKFMSYEGLSNLHAKTTEVYCLERGLDLG